MDTMKMLRSRTTLQILILVGLGCVMLNMIASTSFNRVEIASKGDTDRSLPLPVASDQKLHGQNLRKLLLKQKITDHHISTSETYHVDHNLEGGILGDGDSVSMLQSPVVSCLIHSFSPWIEKTAASRFVDPEQSNVFYANSPAITWYGEELVLVIRIWLDREQYEKHENWPANHFADNYFYTQKFNRYLEPMNSGQILGIPMPKQFWVGDGPIEPRLIQVNDTLLISFNAGVAFKQDYFIDWTLFWDYFNSKPILPVIKGGSPVLKGLSPGAIPCDKHWMPFTIHDELYFIHSLDPLRILKCTVSGQCYFVHQHEGNFTMRDRSFHFRGGTPLELYRWPYYIGFAHSTLYKMEGNRYYAAHLIVFCVKPMRIVYISDPIKIHDAIYAKVPIIRRTYIKDAFIFPVGIILEDSDSVVLGAHVNDHSSMLFRIHGIKKLMDNVIHIDKSNKPVKGPPVMSVQNYIHKRLQVVTGFEFYN